jgi:hypothetical protein
MILKKINLIFFGILFAIGNNVNGQELLPVMYDSTLANRQIIMNGSFFQHGSSLKNDFSRKFIFGGEISDELSQRTYESQKKYNRIGGGAKFRIAYKSANQIFKSKPNWSWMIDLANEVHGTADYSGDLLGLAFLGNASFLGESVNFSNSSAQYVQYLSIGGGIHNRKNKNFISLNAILPQNFFMLSVNKGNVSFTEDGANIDLILQGEILEAAADPYFKGLGAAVNFDFNIPFGNSESFSGVMKVTGRNLGFYQLHNAKLQEIDNSISYSGFQLADFANDSQMTTLKDTLGVRESTTSPMRLLPGFIQVGKVATADSKHKLQSTFGVRMYTNYFYKPMIYLGVHYQPLTSFSLGSQISYGGYGGFRLGLYANYTAKNIMIGIGTEDILGALLKSQYGHSGLIRLAWKF